MGRNGTSIESVMGGPAGEWGNTLKWLHIFIDCKALTGYISNMSATVALMSQRTIKGPGK
jgi:hypothetical protein